MFNFAPLKKTNIKRNKIMKLMKTLLFGATMLVMAACGGNKDGEAAKQDARTPETDGAKAAELEFAYYTAETDEAREKAQKDLEAFAQEVQKLYGEDKAAQKKFEEAYRKKAEELSQKMQESLQGAEMQMMEGEEIDSVNGMEQVAEEAEIAEIPAETL